MVLAVLNDPFYKALRGEKLPGAVTTTNKANRLFEGIVPTTEELKCFVSEFYPVLYKGSPDQPLYSVPKSNHLPLELSNTPTTKDPVVIVDIGGTNIRITWIHGKSIKNINQKIDDFCSDIESTPEAAMKKICKLISELDPEKKATRFAVIYSFPQDNYLTENGIGASVLGSDVIQKRVPFLGKGTDGIRLDEVVNPELTNSGFKVELLVISNDTNFTRYAVRNADTAVIISSGANALLPWFEGAPRNGEIGAFIEIPERYQSKYTLELARNRKASGGGICSFESVIAGNLLPFELADHLRVLIPKVSRFQSRAFIDWVAGYAQASGTELIFALADEKWDEVRRIDEELFKILSPSIGGKNGLAVQLSLLCEALRTRSAGFGAAMITLASEKLLRETDGEVVVALDSSLARASGIFKWELEEYLKSLTGNRVRIELCSDERYSPSTKGALKLLTNYPKVTRL